MNNNEDIFLLLNLPNDGNIQIDKVSIEDNIKTIHISRKALPTYCPVCGARMHSKGIYKRTVNHQILQDKTKLVLIIHQRKWKCTNCNTYINESFPFLDRYSHCTNLIPLLVLDALKDLNRSTASVAAQFSLSDTQVHDIFTAYVDLPRLPLPAYLSIDEVHLDINDKEKYALVLMDFVTGEIVDILHNRWETTAEDYFYSIPRDERKNVLAVISDAYKSYLDYPEKFFPNAVSILDSFHVSKILINGINNYINIVMKRYQEKDKKTLEQKNYDNNSNNKTIKASKEVTLLRSYRWILLKNKDEINYSSNRYYHKLLKMHVDTYTVEKMFLDLDINFRKIRDLKEKYIAFNHTFFESEMDVEIALNALIEGYKASDLKIFNDFAITLETYRKQIIRSFTTVEVSRKSKNEVITYYARLSNGPMESFNRKPKDYKRNTRGSSNFDYTRNRILWSTRKNPAIKGVPKSKEQVHSYKRKPRGKYNKKKKK